MSKRNPIRRPAAVELDGKLVAIGDKVPLPPPERAKVLPSRNADDPARGPRRVFTNGRGGAR